MLCRVGLQGRAAEDGLWPWQVLRWCTPRTRARTAASVVLARKVQSRVLGLNARRTAPPCTHRPAGSVKLCFSMSDNSLYALKVGGQSSGACSGVV